MSEKRYTLKEYDNYQYVAFDEDKPLINLKLKSFGKYAGFHRIIDSLNEKEDEITLLKKEIKELKLKQQLEFTETISELEDNILYIKDTHTTLKMKGDKMHVCCRIPFKDGIRVYEINQYTFKAMRLSHKVIIP